MGESVLVFISHSSDDKQEYVEPIVRDLEDCYIDVWLDKRKIVPGDNLRKSIFRNGLDKADIALIFFTAHSLKSSWVDREVKHVLREESKKGNNFDLNKIISIFDSKETYEAISKQYPELTDDLLHLMPKGYSKIELGQLVSAIWSKYLDLQDEDVEIQKQLLAKDKEISELANQVSLLKSKSSASDNDFESYLKSGKIDQFIKAKDGLLSSNWIEKNKIPEFSNAMAFGLVEYESSGGGKLSPKGIKFFKWLILNAEFKS